MDATISPRFAPTRRLFLAGALASATAACSRAGATELPRVDLPGIDGLRTGAGWPVPGIPAALFDGGVTLLNVWATWCPVCRSEHGFLMRLSGQGRYKLVGLACQDTPEKVRDYLRRNGNPFAALAMDDGTLRTALGKPGFPTTFVIDRKRRVVGSFVASIDENRFRDDVMPAIRAAQAAA